MTIEVSDEMRDAILQIKAMVCGDRYPRWTEDGVSVTRSRVVIADICDRALAASPSAVDVPREGDRT